MNEPIYYRNGRKYKKVTPHGTIDDYAMVSCCGGELMPISELDDDVCGMTPSEVSDELDFFNLIEDQYYAGATY